MPRKILLLLLMAVFTTELRAQLSIVTSNTTICQGASTSLQAQQIGRTPVYPSINGSNDAMSSLVSIGFSFTFYGVAYNQCVISTNGYISFNAANANTSSPATILSGVPGGDPQLFNSIMGVYTDWSAVAANPIDYATIGSAPNRRFIVNYCSISSGAACFNAKGSFQIILYETSNNIDIHIGNKPACASVNNGSGIEGVQDGSGGDAVVVSGRNYPTPWTAFRSSHRFTPSGVTYTVTSIPYAPLTKNNALFTWYLNDVTPIGTTAAINVSPTVNSFYTVRKIECQDTLRDTVYVDVTPTPVVGASSNTPICQNDVLELYATTLPGATYSWSGPNGFSSLSQNPVIPMAQPSDSGLYYVTATVSGCPSNPTDVNAIVNRTPVIVGVSTISTTTCGGSDGAMILGGLIPGETYVTSYTYGGIPQPPLNLVASASGQVTIPNLSAGDYTDMMVSVYGCESLPVGLRTITDPSPPLPPVLSSNSPVCQGSTFNLYAATSVPGATFNWIGPGSFFSNAQNPVINNAQASNGGTYGVTITAYNCTSVQETINIIVNQIPVIGNIVATGPTTCGGANGTMTISGLTPLTIFSVSFAKNGNPQTPVTVFSTAGGSATVTGLTAGTYTNVIVSYQGCPSTAAGPLVISDPIPPAPPVVSNSGPVCQGDLINLSASGVAGGSYSWSGPGSYSSAVQNPSIANAQAVNAGNYSVTVTLNNCPSTSSVTNVVVNLTPVVSSTTITNPTTCGGTNGSIGFNGLNPNTLYSLSYTKNGSSQPGVSISSNSSGTLTLSNLGLGIYDNIVFTLNSCPSQPIGPLVVNDPNAPAPPTISSNSPVCEGAILNLTASGLAGGSYSWTGPASYTASTQNPAISNVQLNYAGNYSVSVMVNNCSSVPATTTVSITALPVIAGVNSTNPTTCGGNNGSISISGVTANTSYSVAYSKNSVVQPTVNIVSSATGTLDINGLTAGTYSNIIITLNNCGSLPAGPVILSDPAAPPAPVASSNSPICQGSTLTLDASVVANATYNWTGPSAFASSSQNTSLAGALPANSGVYSVTATVNNCTSAAGTVNVTVHPTPATPAPSSNSPVCDGFALNLSVAATAGASYSWSGPNSFSSNGQNPTINPAGLAAAGVYDLTITVNNCVSAAGSATVVVNPIPAAPSTANISFCQASTAAALTATGQNLLWYTLPSGGAGSSIAPVPSTVSSGTFNWYVSQTVNGCESPRATLTVTIIPKPAAPAVTSPITYCQFQSSTALTAIGQDLLWYVTASGGSGSVSAPVPLTTVPANTTYYVSQTVNGCESDRSPLVVTVYAKPDTPLIANPVLYCVGQAANPLTAQGQNLLWYSSGTGGTGSAAAPTPVTSATGTTYYYVSQTINGCEGDRGIVEVVVNPSVTADISLVSGSICQYDTISVSGNGANPAGAGFTWNFDGATVISGTGAGPYEVKWLTPGTKTVSLQVNNLNCNASDAQVIDVNPSPTSEFVLKDHICVDEKISVETAWNTSTAIYSWNFSGANVLSGTGAGPYQLQWTGKGAREVSLVVTDGGCNSERFADTLIVHELPPAKIEVEQIGDHVCVGSEILLKAKEMDVSLSYTYAWTPEQAFLTNGQENVVARVINTGYIYLTVTDPYGCKGSDSLFTDTQLCCDVYIPDAFSPNKDGKNDIFRLITQGHHQLSTFRITNRWGQTVFQTLNEEQGWDGTLGGEPQDMGVYYYYLRYRCGEVILEKKGEVTLVR